MTRNDAEILIAKLDNLEARARDVEVGMTRIRRELQDQFHLKTWDYDPAKPAVKPATVAAEVHGFNCPKVFHDPQRSGYLHGSDDDSPFNDDGLSYCGRCHRALP